MISFYACLLAVNPGTYGRGTTAGFHQLLFKLHGQDQTAKEEVMTTVNKSSSKVVPVFILQIVFLTYTSTCDGVVPPADKLETCPCPPLPPQGHFH